MTEKPTPKITEINHPFWEGCNSEELRLQRCVLPECQRYIYYPRPCCPYCGSEDVSWKVVSGNGVIRSFARITRPQTAAFQADVPYYFGAIQLKEGPTLFSRLTEAPASDRGLIGRSVTVRFVEYTPSQKLPFFHLS